MSAEEELPPSKLGTKEHWDHVYDREVRVFNDIGDEGEVWFGETAVEKMRDWAHEHLPPTTSSPLRILECGSGNGTLLLSFLTSPEEPPQSYHLTGIDYSPQAAVLARSVELARREHLANPSSDDEDSDDEDKVINNVPEADWRVGDLLRDDIPEQWDLVLDKGTFDALCLSSDPVEEDREKRVPSLIYPERISRLVKDGGFFLITSCNFTEEEITRRWTRDGLGFTFHSSVPHPSFTFGGKKGTTVCTVALQKTGPSPEDTIIRQPTASASTATAGSSESGEKLYTCIDCGGTKTEVAIASLDGVLVRAEGGTGNMAEVGLQAATDVITATVIKAIQGLPQKYKPSTGATTTCPIEFGDVWVGMSGCDTALDQKRMSEALIPFFGRAVPVFNDAHLLGGALLTHHCPWGIAVIAGTGSVVVALEQNEELGTIEQIGRRGGTGYLLGDDGSAYDVGRAALRLMIDDYDQGLEEGPLAQTIKRHFQVDETGEILAKVYDLDPTLSPVDSTTKRKLLVSSLARPILEAHAQSPPDDLALRAIRDATAPLIKSIISLARQLTRLPSSSATAPRQVIHAALIMGGGVIRQEGYRTVVLDALRDAGLEFGVHAVVDDVAGEGALGLVEKARGAKDSDGQ